MLQLGIGIAAAIAFPILAIIVHQQRDSRRNRRAGRRRNDRIQL
ncbi:MAG TPA: hypothetical protein VGB70_13600 [Allosphingosinicella sp.]